MGRSRRSTLRNEPGSVSTARKTELEAEISTLRFQLDRLTAKCRCDPAPTGYDIRCIGRLARKINQAESELASTTGPANTGR